MSLCSGSNLLVCRTNTGAVVDALRAMMAQDVTTCDKGPIVGQERWSLYALGGGEWALPDMDGS